MVIDHSIISSSKFKNLYVFFFPNFPYLERMKDKRKDISFTPLFSWKLKTVSREFHGVGDSSSPIPLPDVTNSREGDGGRR